MLGSDRRLAILVAGSYLALGFGAWAISPVGAEHILRGQAGGGSMVALWAAAAVFAAAAALFRDRVTPWLVLALVGPLALQPLTQHRTDDATMLLALLWPASILPLGLSLAEGPRGRTAVLSAAAAAVSVGLATIASRGDAEALSFVQYVAVASIVALPALVRGRRSTDDPSLAGIAERSDAVIAAVAPAISGLVLVTSWQIGVAALAATLVSVAIGGWIAVRPLAWLAARSRAQRDLAVAISEAERRRLAADLHDGPLQDVLLLARRLDATGDVEGAVLARAIGSELRELSGDLRLPLLDDLGVGPALEWLAGRVRGLTAADVQVAHTSSGRVPPPVELAAFRIAQEAIANAVRHGSPPIRVHCRTAPGALTLWVEDAGLGLSRSGQQPGSVRFGVLNMQQRAEQVGAHLEWRRPRAGGTLVALEWRANLP